MFLLPGSTRVRRVESRDLAPFSPLLLALLAPLLLGVRDFADVMMSLCVALAALGGAMRTAGDASTSGRVFFWVCTVLAIYGALSAVSFTWLHFIQPRLRRKR